MVGWAAWSSDEAEHHENHKGGAHRAECSEAEESQAFGRKEEGFMGEVVLSGPSGHWWCFPQVENLARKMEIRDGSSRLSKGLGL